MTTTGTPRDATTKFRDMMLAGFGFAPDESLYQAKLQAGITFRHSPWIRYDTRWVAVSETRAEEIEFKNDGTMRVLSFANM